MNRLSSLIVALLTVLLLATFFPVSGTSAGQSADDISYVEGAETITIQTDEMIVSINKAFPAAAVRHTDDHTDEGLGFIFDALLGYNATTDDLLALEDVPYHAPFDRATWNVLGPFEDSDPAEGNSVSVTLQASVTIHKKLADGGSGKGGSGTPGAENITDWASVSITFKVTTRSYNTTYAIGSPVYQVNGTTDLKFDVDISLNQPILANRLAADMSVLAMDDTLFEPSTTFGPYLLCGYQASGITESDPSVNETLNDTPLIHRFQHRSQFKQMFAFVKDNETLGHFSWASEAMLSWSGTNDSLADITTFYRTDGEALKVYVSSPLDVAMTSVAHDPSIGIFEVDGVPVDLPDGTIFGSSVMSLAIGAIIAVAVAGGAGVYVVMRRIPEDEDPGDVVSLTRNRYFRGKI